MSERSKQLLSTLLVLGAQSPERALASDELATKIGVKVSDIEGELKRLLDAGYAKITSSSGTPKVYLTGTGIITASSTYS
jgi:DNA-binding MarR family transcriptional regulator